jgi:hypothetical protein
MDPYGPFYLQFFNKVGIDDAICNDIIYRSRELEDLMHARTRLAAALVLIGGLFMSCDGLLSMVQPLIGTWESSVESITFTSTSYELKIPSSGKVIQTGTYSTSGNQLTLYYTDSSNYERETQYTYSISASKLTITSSNGSSEVLTKAK